MNLPSYAFYSEMCFSFSFFPFWACVCLSGITLSFRYLHQLNVYFFWMSELVTYKLMVSW